MKHLLPVLLALFLLTACGAPAGTAGPAPETVNSADFEEVDLTTVFDQDWGAGVPLPLDGETRAEYAVLLREQMETAYSVMADCTGLSIWPNRRELGEPWYDADGEAWYPFPGYAGVDEVRAAIQDAFTADSAAFLDRYLDPEGSPWLKDMDGGLWWRGSGYLDGAVFQPPERYCFDSLALLSKSENRLEFVLMGATAYGTPSLERFTLLREDGTWKLDGYGGQAEPLDDSLPGALWVHTMDLLDTAIREEGGYTGDIPEIHQERLLRYPDQLGEDGDVFRIYRAYPAFLLDQSASTTSLAPLLRDGWCRPENAPWLVFLLRDGGQVWLGALPAEAGTPDSELFQAHRDLLLAQWNEGVAK